MLFVKIPYSIADVPRLRNIFVYPKNAVQGKQIQEVRETQFRSECSFGLKKGGEPN
jgi:hypothetical protein